MLHAGGKFGDGGGYKVSGGLHGVGVSVVNALSEWLDLTIWRDGNEWTQSYERGTPMGELEKGAKTDRHGTEHHLPAGPRDLRDDRLRRTVLEQRFREMAFLTKGLKIGFGDERGERFETSFQYEGGIVDFVKYLHSQGTREPLHKKVVYVEDASDIGEVEVALQWNDSYQETLLSFANNINTHEGGTHLSGFRSALTRTINAYARQKGELKEKDPNLQGEDIREGLTAIISVKIPDPQFEGQTKTKLGNPPVEGFVQAAVNKGLAEFLEENPTDAQQIISKAVAAPARPRGGAQGARPDAPQVGARELDAARQARRLLGARPRARRDLHRRGRLRRRLGQAGPRPQHPGGPAAARQDHQRREEPHRQGPLQQGDPGADHRDRHRASARSSTSRRPATTRSSS